MMGGLEANHEEKLVDICGAIERLQNQLLQKQQVKDQYHKDQVKMMMTERLGDRVSE